MQGSSLPRRMLDLFSLILSYLIFWALLLALLDWIPGGRFVKRVVRRVFDTTKRFISGLYRRAKKIIKGYFDMTLFIPARRRGVIYGVWVFSLLPTILATLFFTLSPDSHSTNGMLMLWGWIILGVVLIRFRAYWVQARARYPLPGRRRRRRYL